MSSKYEKLTSLLQELFQLDQPDLDFGIYRVMHAKSAEVSQFLDKDLLPQVQAAFGQYKTADKAELEKELAKVIAGIEAAGMDPAQSPKVADMRARLANDAVDIGALESEVYDHLFSFFRRYYDQGDFLAKRVYKPGVYAIPYEGEKVTLHWANKDQYYIKTSEYLRDYAFRLRPDDDKQPMRVHFRLADAVEGEHGNVKAAEGKDRVFILAAPEEPGRDFIAEDGGEQGKELVIRFEYRPATIPDWPDEARMGKSKPPAQKDLSALAAKGTISEHVKHIFEDKELEEDSVVRLFRTTAADGKQYEVAHYNLDMVLALGFRVRSPVAVRFRQWAADKLKEYIIKGFVLDDERLKNPKAGNDYFDELTRRIQDSYVRSMLEWAGA